MKTLNEFITGIRENTLLISCMDCFVINVVADNPFVIHHSALAGMVSPDNGFDTDFLNQYIDRYQITQILVVGHTACGVLNFMQKRNIRPCWSEFKKALQSSVKSVYTPVMQRPVEPMSRMQAHIKQQIRNVSDTLADRLSQHSPPIQIRGFVVDEMHQNRVFDVDDIVEIIAVYGIPATPNLN